MTINDQIPLSAGPAGAATIDARIPLTTDQRLPLSTKPFQGIDLQGAADDAIKNASNIETFKSQQAKNLEQQRLTEESQRDRTILQQYQQSGGDLYSADGMQVALKDLGNKLSPNAIDGLNARLSAREKETDSHRAAVAKLSDSDFDALKNQSEQTAKVMNRALSAYDTTLASTKDTGQATDAYNSAKAALVQGLQSTVSPTTGKPMYADADLQSFANMPVDQLRTIVNDSAWKQNALKEEAANRLRNAQVEDYASKSDKRDSDVERDIAKNKILADKVAGLQGAPLQDADAATMAEYVRVQGPSALSRYGLTPVQRQQVMSKVTSLNSGEGISAREGATAPLDIKANQASLNKMVPQLDAITAYEKTMENIGGKLVDIAKAVDSTGVPVIERWIRAGKKSVAGDPDVTEFNSRMNTFRTEAARVINNPNLTGVLSDSARHEVEDMIPNSATAEQIERGVKVLISEGVTRKQNLQEQIDIARNRNKAGAKPGMVSQADFPVVTPAEQNQRDKTSLDILQSELDSEMQKSANATTDEDRNRANNNAEAISRQMMSLKPKVSVTVAASKPTISNW